MAMIGDECYVQAVKPGTDAEGMALTGTSNFELGEVVDGEFRSAHGP
jgi:hypothetical protein